MAKMSFAEYLKAREEYLAYAGTDPEDPKQPEEPAEDPKQPEEPAEDPKQPEEPAKDDDMRKELDDVKKALALMAKAMQPTLGDIEPVGIDDVVKRFFDVKED